MLNENKIKLMTKLAVFEESEGKQEIKLSKYYKTDYMRLNLIKSVISVTLGYMLILAMVVIYKSEDLISQAVQLDYKAIGIKVLGIYIMILTCYIFISIIAYSSKYKTSKKKLSKYVHNLNCYVSFIMKKRQSKIGEERKKMMNLLVLKEKIKILYQKAELYIDPLVKFIIAMVVFIMINNEFGYNTRLNSIPVVLILSLLCAFTPSAVLVLLAATVFVGHVYAVSKILSIIVILILFILYFLFARFTPKQGYIILALPILYFLKIPYVIPIALGVISTPIAIVPVGCGVVAYYMLDVIRNAAEMNTNTSVEETLSLYKFVIDSLMHNKLMIFTLVMFAIVILVTYLIRKINMDHAFDIAIASGGIVTILGFLIGDLGFDISNNIGAMILGTIISMVLAYIIQFFRLTLDYTGVERVQFEDDDYYYYVKAVPKINVTAPKKNVKRINPQKSGRVSSQNKEAEYDDFEPYDATKDNSNLI